MAIVSVYIEEGCITCDACEEILPEVFHVTDDTCFIHAEVRLDGGYDRNEGKAGLKPETLASFEDELLDAADGCPVDVIIIVESGEAAASEPEVAAAPAVEAAAEPMVSEPIEVAGDDIDELLSVGDRSLAILFGSQSGNSEELAAKLAKQAANYGLEGTVYDMDGFDFGSLSGMKRVLIVCSTWGEGEMPDNAEDLWQISTKAPAGSLSGVHYSVCALGDTSYEFFCESGKEWDEQFEKLGATRLVDRVDCDVDYDAPAAAWALEALAALAAVDGAGVYHEDMVEAIKAHAAGDVGGADGEDGFSVPVLTAAAVQAELSIFRYDPEQASTGSDTWICSMPGNLSLLEALRTIKSTHDGSLSFRDGAADDPSTAICVNGRLVLPGMIRLDAVAPTRDGVLSLRVDPLPGFEVIRDLVVDHWPMERRRESTKPWMVAATREGAATMQGAIGVMDPNVASALHSITDFSSAALLQASSDAVPHANGYLGPSVLASAWARRNDPRSSHSSVASLDSILGSPNGIKAETDLASIRRQNGSGVVISEALLDARTHVLEQDAFTGRHGKHVWWYAWTLKSSGKVNDTVLYRQVLGPIGLIGNLTSGVTARMVTGFTRTGGDMFYDMLAMVAPPAGLGKMPRQFNSSVENHHEVVAIFNELDGRF
ncbi:MAG: flavodoxin domain-containing protein [Candidatus Thalassarchaeaceae archaeon]|jgi:flavodoxin/succinate dehydrogenase/fumarate reductase-like Fe-S protein/ferredoxin|nr:flavodoxin domain-containing protein [Candidatus Thalassarchaeaceae archaeon]